MATHNYMAIGYLVVPYGQLEITFTQAEYELLLEYAKAKPIARRLSLPHQQVVLKITDELTYLAGLGFVGYDDSGVARGELTGTAEWRITATGVNFVRLMQTQMKRGYFDYESSKWITKEWTPEWPTATAELVTAGDHFYPGGV
jgi:hypothetical protein